MARAEALEEGWGGPLRVMRERPEFVAEVLRRVEDEGPVGAGDLREGPAAGRLAGGRGTTPRSRWSTCSGPAA